MRAVDRRVGKYILTSSFSFSALRSLLTFVISWMELLHCTSSAEHVFVLVEHMLLNGVKGGFLGF